MNEIKSKFDSLFIFAAQVNYTSMHPLKTIHACKSLIGIDFKNPSIVLLKWLENYLKDFSPNFLIPQISDENIPEVITYSKLKTLINSKKEQESHEYLSYLLKIATPLSIAEYLIELSSQKSASNLLYSWCIYRTIQFLGEKDGYKLLYQCVSNLVNGNLIDKEENILKNEIKYHQFQIRSEKMIRSNKIFPLLNILINRYEQDLDENNFFVLSEFANTMIIKNKLDGIKHYINTLDIDQISKEMIFHLDAIRSAIIFSNFSVEQIVNRSFIKLSNNDYA